MSDNYRVKWEEQVSGHDPVQAAESAVEMLKSGHLRLIVSNAHGEATTIEMGGDNTNPYYRVIGLDTLFSPKTVIFQAEDRQAAREIASEYGVERVIHIEQTILTEDTEAEIQGWITSIAGGMAAEVRVETSSAWGGCGTITLMDADGQMQMHNYSRINDGNDQGLLDASMRRIQTLCVQMLTELGKVVQVGATGADFLKVDGTGASLFVCRDTGEVKGWKATSLTGFQWAVEVLIVDVIGGMDMLDDVVDIAQLCYWTKHGDCIKPEFAGPVGVTGALHMAV